GIGLRAVAPACEHRGLRTPYISDVEASHAGIVSSGSAAAAFFQRGPAYRLFSALTDVEDDGLPHRLGLRGNGPRVACWG
ncbi:MAG: hypothetical protein MUF66_11520, partial [Gammaproteobacteria bacterium]|nr:hypothetical protein [Gammaproteobacteria bacterium]